MRQLERCFDFSLTLWIRQQSRQWHLILLLDINKKEDMPVGSDDLPAQASMSTFVSLWVLCSVCSVCVHAYVCVCVVFVVCVKAIVWHFGKYAYLLPGRIMDQYHSHVCPLITSMDRSSDNRPPLLLHKCKTARLKEVQNGYKQHSCSLCSSPYF